MVATGELGFWPAAKEQFVTENLPRLVMVDL
jgi:hypothetical protein